MSLEHILLGYLREPATGYELGKRFEDGAQHFWFAERSQIYPTLKKLEKRGWLDCRSRPSARGPRRKVYETTKDGREELRRWLREGPHLGRTRLPYVAQTFFLGALESAEESVEIVRGMAAEWRARLELLEQAEAEVLRGHGDPPVLDLESTHYYAALRLGLQQLRGRIAWCDETIARLKASADATESPEREDRRRDGNRSARAATGG